MLRKISLLLCILVLSGCTLAPEVTPVPKTECPACPTAAPCPTCVAASTCAPPPTVLPLPTETATPLPTATTEPSATPLPTATAIVQPTSSAPPPFALQDGTPALLQNFVHPDRACKWMGVGGQVIATDGSPLVNIVVVVNGSLNGQPVDLIGLTGSTMDYGAGGYEIELAAKTANSKGELSIQLFDLDGIPLSDPVLFDTAAECTKNLVLINFSENNSPTP